MHRPQQSTTLSAEPPGPRGLPVVGNAFAFGRDPLGFVTETQRAFGEIATVRLGSRAVVLCLRPEHVRALLVEQASRVTPLGIAPLLTEFLGDGLLTSDGDFHHEQRRLIQPAFHRRRIDGYAATMVGYTEEMLEGWEPGAEIDLSRAMATLTLRIVARALFSVDLEADAAGAALGRAFHDLIESLPQGFGLLPRLRRLDLPFTGYRRHLAARRRLDAYVYDLIARRRAAGDDTGDVLAWLLDAGDGDDAMTDRQIRDQTMTLFAAGHETTANALSWSFYLLSENPAVRDRLLAELAAVLAGRAPTVADLPRLTYLDWVATESMRLYPPAWTQGRVAREPLELVGYRFPAGTRFMFSQWVIHRRPDIWGDADVFRPERWDPEAGEKPPQWAYFPFGGGPRTCIGMPFAQMELRLLLATILQRYAPRLVSGHPVVPWPRITLRPKYGMRMILEPAGRVAPVPGTEPVRLPHRPPLSAD